MIIPKISSKHPEQIFMCLGLIFGFLFLIFTPIFKVPDEPLHLLRACEVSNGIFYNDKNGNPAGDIFPNRKILLRKNCVNFQEFKNKYYFNSELFDFNNLNYTHNNTGYSFIMYLPSALAIKPVSLFTHNPYLQFYSARFANFFMYLLLIYSAIKLTPVFKWQLLVCALFPMALYEGVSVSADSFNLGFCFLYISLFFKLIFDKEKSISKKQFSLLLFLSFISIFLKGCFIFTLLVFLIPKDKFSNKRYLLWLWIGVLLILSFLYSSYNFIFIRPQVDFTERLFLLQKHPLIFVKAFINTSLEMWKSYIVQSIGALDLLKMYLPAYQVFCFIYLFAICSFLDDIYCKLSVRIFTFIVISCFITATFVLYFLTYSYSLDFIEGVQGRYFLPLYPLLAVVIHKPLNLTFTNKQKLYLKYFIVLSLLINLILTLFYMINWFWNC